MTPLERGRVSDRPAAEMQEVRTIDFGQEARSAVRGRAVAARPESSGSTRPKRRMPPNRTRK